MTQYLSAEEILRLHFQIIKDFGGSHGVRGEGRLLAVEAAPQQIVFGEEQYKTIFEKAAVYFHNIVGDHPFTDGNKRTAVTAAGVFLLRNKIRLTASTTELEDFAVRVAVDHLTVTEIADWIEDNSIAV